MASTQPLSAAERSALLGRLELPPEADREAIRRSYRRLASRMHPDHDNDVEATDRFLALDSAYRQLLEDDPHRDRPHATEPGPDGRIIVAADPAVWLRVGTPGAAVTAPIVAGAVRWLPPAAGRRGR